MILRPPRSTPLYSSAASDVYKRQLQVWSQETFYTDCAQPPLLYEDGEFKRVEIFGRREQRAGEAALHVHGAAAVDPAVPDGRVPGRRRPAGFIADRHHVDVAVEHEVAAGARAAGAAACGSPSGRTLCGALAHPADHAEGFVTLHFGAVVGVLRQFPEVDPPDVGREPGSLHPGADGALRGALGAVETRNRDQFTQERGERVEVERVEGALFDGAQHAAAGVARSGM